jgi:predicted transcriptional regulator
MNVGSMCKRAVVTIDAGRTIREAATLMRVQHIGAVVVTAESDGRSDAVGVVTDRDLMLASVAHTLAPSEVLVGALVQRRLATIQSTASTAQAAHALRTAGVRRLLVIDSEGSVCGLLSSDDLLAALIQPLEELVGAFRAGIDNEESGTARVDDAAGIPMAFRIR